MNRKNPRLKKFNKMRIKNKIMMKIFIKLESQEQNNKNKNNKFQKNNHNKMISKSMMIKGINLWQLSHGKEQLKSQRYLIIKVQGKNLL